MTNTSIEQKRRNENVIKMKGEKKRKKRGEEKREDGKLKRQ